MTKTEMLTEVRARLGETSGYDTGAPDPGDFWKDSEINRRLDEALARFANEEEWDWLVTHFSAGSPLIQTNDTIVLQDDVNINRSFSLVLAPPSGRPVLPRRVTPFEGPHLTAFHSGTTGRPQWYYILDNTVETGPNPKVRVAPAADAEYIATYQYIRRPTWQGGAGEPDIPEDYHTAIVAKATALCWLKEWNPAGREKWEEQTQEYTAILEQARADQMKGSF